MLPVNSNSLHSSDPPCFMVKMKPFVKSSEIVPQDTNSDIKLCQNPKPAFVSGKEVKSFYEKTVGKRALETSSKIIPKKPNNVGEPSLCKDNSSKMPFNINIMMKAVEAGNCKKVRKMLEDHEECVDCKDQFGWTPLMAASCTGNVVIVELLLEWKPDLKVLDKKGNSCLTLAEAKGHTKILEILNKYLQNLNNTPDDNKCYDVLNDEADSLQFYCEVCKQSFQDTSYRQHLSSMVHNFNTASKRRMPTMYGIPESNKGFQILVKAGWNKEEGLGPSGEGHKFPPKTILKQDRTGLGAKRYKPRVTHTPEDARREATPKNTLKRQLKSDKMKSQRHERYLRRMLS